MRHLIITRCLPIARCIGASLLLAAFTLSAARGEEALHPEEHVFKVLANLGNVRIGDTRSRAYHVCHRGIVYIAIGHAEKFSLSPYWRVGSTRPVVCGDYSEKDADPNQ